MKQFLNKLLDRIGKKFGIDVSYFFNSTFYLSLGYVADSLKGIILSALYARILTQEVFGQYNYILIIIGVVTVISLPGMHMAISQAVARGYDKTLSKATKTVFKWGWLASLAFILIAIFFQITDQQLFAVILLVIAAIFPFYTISRLYEPFLTGKKSFGLLTKYNVIFSISATILLGAAVLFRGDLLWLIVCFLLVNTLINGYFTLKANRSISNDLIDPDSIKYGKKLTGINAIMTFRAYFDKLIIANFLGFTDLAIYTIAAAIADQEKIIGTFLRTLIPKLSPLKKKDAYNAVNQKKYIFFGLVIILTAMLIIVTPFLIKILYGDDYARAIPLAIALIVSNLMGVSSFLFSYLLFSQKEVKKTYKINVAFCVIEIISIIVLSPLFGLWGVVSAKIISRSSRLAIAWFVCRKI